MQSILSCHKCIKSLEEAVGTRSSWTLFKSVPKRRMSSWTGTRHISSPKHARPVLGQQRNRSDGVLGWYQTQQIEDALNRPPVYRRRPVPEFDPFKGPLIPQDDLFHPFSNSPISQIRRRATYMKTHAYCPHPSHRPTRIPTSPHDSEARKATSGVDPPAFVKFECPDCGIPVSCSEEHWADDYENHMEICDTLRQINEDDHDLRSNRFFYEFQYPGPPIEEAIVNMLNWDTYLYTANFPAVNADRSMRQVTKLLTYPLTIGSVISEFSPYDMKAGGRLTYEGLRSFTALRYSLHPEPSGAGHKIQHMRQKPPPVRIFVLGARAESSLPRDVWVQLGHLFRLCPIHVILVGPESMMNRDAEWPLPDRTPGNPFGAIVEDDIMYDFKMSTFVEYYHTMHKTGYFHPFDPYFDCFVLFHPGLGHPASSHEWAETLPMLLETKVPIICTGYTEWDMNRDRRWVEEQVGSEIDLLMEPGENRFRSLRWDLNDLDPTDISCGNWGVWAFRGKRYETTKRD